MVMSRVLQAVQAAGQTIAPDAVAALSPYITEHIDRFGRYSLDGDQHPPPLDEPIFSTAWLPSTDQERVRDGRRTPRRSRHNSETTAIVIG
jgi:hypothetical protein